MIILLPMLLDLFYPRQVHKIRQIDSWKTVNPNSTAMATDEHKNDDSDLRTWDSSNKLKQIQQDDGGHR